MAKVIILCGKIASGKTYYANQLKNNIGALILSLDELLLKLSDTCLGGNHDDISRRCERYFYELAEQITRSGINVVIDFGYWTKSERDEARTYFQNKDIQFELHYLNTDEEKRIVQLEKRNKVLTIRQKEGSTDRVYIINESLRERLDNKFEEPTKEEIDILVF